MEIEYDALVEGLIDLRWMCEAPRPGERSLALDGSSDSGLTALKHKGAPGVVGRIWCSRRDGVLRVWVDGAEAPVLVWRLSEFSEVARPEGLPPDPLAGSLGRGWYSLVPIPYSRELRFEFEAEGGGAARLQADLRELGKGVFVRACDADTLRRHDPALRRVARIIVDDENPKTDLSGMASGEVYLKQEHMIDPAAPHYDGTYYYEVEGVGSLRWWTLKLLFVEDRAEIEAIMRGVVLSFEVGTKDHSEQGYKLLEIPLGDFFGLGAGRDPYESYLMGLREDGSFVCRLPMPFGNHLKMLMRYPTRPKVKFVMHLGVDSLTHDAVPPLRLRGGWVQADPAADGSFLCALPGPARLVSAAWSSECKTDLEWRDAPAFAFARGMTRPRDGAWSQVTHRDGPGRFGRFSMLRTYAHDAPVAEAGETLHYAAPSRYAGAAGESRAALRLLWYGPERDDPSAAPGAGTRSFGASYDMEGRARWPLSTPQFFAVPNAFEGESLSLSSISAAAYTEVENWSKLETPVSRREVLIFHPSAAGEQFAFTISAPIGGEYELVARTGTGAGLGGLAVFLDGKRIGEIAADEQAERAVIETVLHRGTFLPRPYPLALRAVSAQPIALDCVFLRAVKP